MRKKMDIRVEVPTTLDWEQIDMVVLHRLEELADDLHIQNGRVLRWKGTHYHNAEDMFEDIGSADDPKFESLVAILHVRALVMAQRKKQP